MANYVVELFHHQQFAPDYNEDLKEKVVHHEK
jgi:hypothetical protein